MDCVVTFEHEGKELGLHFDLDAFRLLERRGYAGVLPLYDALRDLRVSALGHALEAGLAGYRRIRLSRNERADPVLAAAAIDAIIVARGLTESRDLLMSAISAAAVRAPVEPEEAAAAEGKAPPTP